MKSLLLFLYFSLLFISCNSQSTGAAADERSRLTGNTFSNSYFGFQLKIDTPWNILNKKELTQLIKERADMLNGSTGSKVVPAKGIDMLLSLTIDTLETMPHVLISSLDLSIFPKIKNEKDYLDDYNLQVKKMYENYDLQITFSEIKQETIGNKTFFTTLITIKGENFLAYQKRYSVKIKDRLLNIMTNYNSDTYLKECMNLLNNIIWE
jgi:hypothetical protein